METLRVALLQQDLIWENPTRNISKLTDRVGSLDSVDLIVLPEMFTTGFSMQAEKLAENTNGPGLQALKTLSEASGAAICGSLIVKEDGRFYNRFYFVTPEGQVTSYDKRHLFTLAEEEKTFTAGTKRVIAHYKGWRFNLQVCYDLRFPVFTRFQDDYDALIYVANWPSKRVQAWSTLLAARSIENICYTLGVNRSGTDGLGFDYPGASAIHDPLGTRITAFSDQETILYGTLDPSFLKATRSKLNFLNDRDSFVLK